MTGIDDADQIQATRHAYAVRSGYEYSEDASTEDIINLSSQRHLKAALSLKSLKKKLGPMGGQAFDMSQNPERRGFRAGPFGPSLQRSSQMVCTSSEPLHLYTCNELSFIHGWPVSGSGVGTA